MARIRSIKPEFWTSEQVLECSRNARLLFVGLWNFCDDEGRHPLSPRQAKAEVFPGDDLTEAEVKEWLDELISVGLICVYAVGGKEYFYVTGWHHQRIDKPQKPKYPEPLQDHSGNDRGTLPPDRIGYDRKDTIGEAASAVASGTFIRVGEPTELETPVTGPIAKHPSSEVPKEGQPGKYEFEGDVIRLLKGDFDKWAKAFPKLDLRAELTARDAWLATAGPKHRESWFVSTATHLRNLNAKAKAGKEFKWASGIEGVY